MKARNTSAPGRQHQRTSDLAALINQLNVWAMAPGEKDRVIGLKEALNAYSKAVKTKKYPATLQNFAMRTGYCNEPPPVVTDSFEYFFGSSKERTDNTPPWSE